MSKRIKGLELMKLCQPLTQNGIVSTEKIANGMSSIWMMAMQKNL